MTHSDTPRLKPVRAVWERDVMRKLEREWGGIALPDSLKILSANSMKEMGHTVRVVVYRFDTSTGMRLRFGVWVNGRRRFDDQIAGDLRL